MVCARGTSPRSRNSTALKFLPKKLSPHTIAFYRIILFGFSVFFVFFFARNVLEDEHQPHFFVDSQLHQITDELWEAPGNYGLHQCLQPSPKYQAAHESDRYISVKSNGGLNQMRTGISDMVAVARIMNATLVIPQLDRRSFWQDSRYSMWLNLILDLQTIK